jgi:hypothetical protein
MGERNMNPIRLRKLVKSFFIFSTFFIFGLWTSIHSWEGEEYMSVSQLTPPESLRDPAAVRRGIDFTLIAGSDFASLSKERILKDATIKIGENGTYGLDLGHFIVRNQNGKPSFACQLYDRVQVKYMGEGVRVNGNIPEMEVDGECHVDSDVMHISTLWIPYKEIISGKPTDGFLTFGDNANVNVKLTNISDSWPKLWFISGVTLKDTTGKNQNLLIERDVISLAQLKSLVMSSTDFDKPSSSNQ